jgi:hypothetical protein
MAFGVGPVLDLSNFVAAANLSAAQYKIVEITGAGQVNVCNNAADRPLGILQNKPRLGETAIVRVLGVSKVVADAQLAVDANYGTSGDGEAVAKVNAGDLVLGRVLEGATNAGELATVTVNGLSLAQV